MLTTIGAVLICVAALWWLSGWGVPSFGVDGSNTVSADISLDEHATIKRLIASTKNEKARALLREVGKALYDE